MAYRKRKLQPINSLHTTVEDKQGGRVRFYISNQDESRNVPAKPYIRTTREALQRLSNVKTLTAADHRLLFALMANEPWDSAFHGIYTNGYAAALNVSRQQINRSLRALVRDGLLETAPHPENPRRYYYRINHEIAFAGDNLTKLNREREKQPTETTP